MDFHPRVRSVAGDGVWERHPHCLDPMLGSGGWEGCRGTGLLWGMGKLEGQSGPLQSLAPRARGHLLFCFRPSMSDRMGFR